MPTKFRKEKYNIGDEAKEKIFSLADEVKRAIWIVVFFALALILFLSLIHKAGTVGLYLDEGMKITFGWGAWVFPFILLFIAVFLAFGKDSKQRTLKLVGSGLLVLVYSALFNLRLPPQQIFIYFKQGQGGGYAGLLFSYPLLKFLGFWAALIVLIALGSIALLLMFETKLFKVGKAVFWIISLTRVKSISHFLQQRLKEKIQGEPKFIEEVQEEANYEKDKQPSETINQNDSTQEKQMRSENLEEDILKKRDENKEIDRVLRSKYRRSVNIPLDLLLKREYLPSSGDIKLIKEKIKKTLQNFSIEVEMDDVSVGPTVTQYTLRPQEGVKLAQITALNNDLALALAAHPIRIEAPIPGKSLVGIEVPNQIIATVGLREILQSEKFRILRRSNLTLALGKDVSGEPYIADLESMPHLLIAGATGSGKSVAIHCIITSLLYQNSPDDLKFILIDPKRVELSLYNNIPHLLTPVITNAVKTINALRWAITEMDRRYDLLSEKGKRNLEGYNKDNNETLPYIIIIIDELADLMSVAPKEVEAAVVRLAQMARAVGIHLILATQRPSVDVITGLIKANITARIAFSVASQVDSRTILDNAGAEKLLGRGDMLFITAELSKPKRLQGAFVSEKELKTVVKFLKEQTEPDYLNEVVEGPEQNTIFGGLENKSLGDFSDVNGGDELLEQARDLIIRTGKASASYLQRHLRIGYARAARILDLLEAEGVIGPSDGAKPRIVLMER